MQSLLDLLKKTGPRPFHWTPAETEPFPRSLSERGTVLALSPHPSDAERAAVFLARLRARGWTIRNAVCTAGVSGVLDRYIKGRVEDADLEAAKARIRRAEALEAARLFGLPEDAVEFLYDRNGNIGRGDPGRDAEAIFDLLARALPDLVTLPSGCDENKTHVGVYEAFVAAARRRPTGKPLVALFHEDPKTIRMEPHLLVWFDRKDSFFKASLIRAHDSQQQRRLERAGEGLDDRILRTNFERAQKARAADPSAPTYPFAEAFEIAVYGGQG